MLSTNQIENLAKSRVETALNAISNIETAFDSKDKFVGFDGNIIIYKPNKSLTTRKENILGMLQSQIKGRTFAKLPKPGKYSFLINKKDMGVYYSENGVLYFVVVFSKKDKKNYRIYYRYLTPYELKQKYKSDSKSGRFTFFEFTAEAEKNFYSYCRRSLELRNEQAIFPQRPIEDQTVNKAIYNEKYVTYCYSGSAEDAVFFDILLDKESETEGKITVRTNTRDLRLLSEVKDWIPSVKLENGFTIPIEQSPIVKFSIHEIRNESLKLSNVAGELFYTRQRIEKIDNYLKVSLSECVELLISEKQITANLNDSGTLADRITAISFLNSLVNNELFIDEKPLRLKNFPKEGLARKLPKMYESAMRIDRLLNDIPILSSLRQKKLPADVINYLEHLSGEYYNISETADEIEFELQQKVIDTISIVIVKNTCLEDGRKLQQFFDPFDGEVDSRIRIFLINDEGEIVTEKISFFCVVNADFWELAMNLNEDVVVDSVFSMDSENKAIREEINLFVLNLLSAYDNVKRENILSLAWKIIKKLVGYGDEDEKYLHINYLQTKKRLFGEFDSDDIAWLVSHIEGQYDKTPIGCACLALLGHKKAAKERLDALSKSDREQITNYPIAYFF